MESGRPKFLAEIHLVDEHGQAHVMQSTKIPFNQPGFSQPAVLGLLVDITERKQTEEALARARDNLERRNQQLAQIVRIGQALRINLGFEALLQEIVQSAQQALGFSLVVLNMLDENDQVRVRAFAGLDEEGQRILANAVYPLPEFRKLMQACFRVECGYFIPQGGFNWQHDFQGPSYRLGLENQRRCDAPTSYHWQPEDVLIVPIESSQGQLVGLLSLDRPLNGCRPDQETWQVLSIFAGQAAVAIENARLYEQLKRDAATKAVLLNEINHRVKNNLAAIVGLLYTEQRHLDTGQPTTYRQAMTGLISRIQGLATVHRLLSAAEWSPLLLSELADHIIRAALLALPPDKQVTVEINPSPVRVTSKQANSLALIINELATNTVKYGTAGDQATHIRVAISQADESENLFEFRDDGPGYPDKILEPADTGSTTNVGLYLVRTLVLTDLRGRVDLYNDQGAVAAIRFKIELA